MSKALWTHNIASLFDMTEETTAFVVPQNVKTISVLVTLWESSARYQCSFVASAKDLSDAVAACEELFQSIRAFENAGSSP